MAQEQGKQPTIDDVIARIKSAKSMKELDDLRMECVKTKSNEVLQLWQRKYRGRKCFRKPIDKGYRYDYGSKQTTIYIQAMLWQKPRHKAGMCGMHHI